MLPLEPSRGRRRFLGRAAFFLGSAATGLALAGCQGARSAAPPSRKRVLKPGEEGTNAAIPSEWADLVWFITRAVDLPVPLRASDFRACRSPRPTDNDFHNSFAAPVEMVSVGGKPLTEALRAKCGGGLRTFLLPYDVNFQ